MCDKILGKVVAYESSAALVENPGFDILLTRTFAKLTKYFPNFRTNCIQPVQRIFLMTSERGKEKLTQSVKCVKSN